MAGYESMRRSQDEESERARMRQEERSAGKPTESLDAMFDREQVFRTAYHLEESLRQTQVGLSAAPA
jgi:hypothetical protein